MTILVNLFKSISGEKVKDIESLQGDEQPDGQQ